MLWSASLLQGRAANKECKQIKSYWYTSPQTPDAAQVAFETLLSEELHHESPITRTMQHAALNTKYLYNFPAVQANNSPNFTLAPFTYNCFFYTYLYIMYTYLYIIIIF